MAFLSLALPLAKRLPFYYGWTVAAVVGLVSFAGVAFGPALLSILFKDMTAEFGWSRSVASGAVLAGSVIMVAIAPVAGRVLDRFGARLVLTVGSLVMALCLLGLAGVPSLLAFYLLFGLGFATFSTTTRVSLGAVVAKWFVRSRGRASALVSILLGLGFVVMPILANLVLSTWGWRAGWLAAAIVVLVVAVPASFLLVRNLPGDVGQEVDGDVQGASPPPSARRTAATEVQWSVREALHTPALWLLLVIMTLLGFAFGGTTIHLVPYLTDRGLEPGYAALAFSVAGLVQVPGSLVWGVLLDRYHVRYAYLVTALLIIGWGVLVSTATANWNVFLIGFVQGVGFGGSGMVQRVIVANYFGRVSAGALLGLAMPLNVVAQGVGAVLSGYLFDLTGTYQGAFMLFLGMLGLSALVNLAVPNPVKPASPSGAPVSG